MLPIIQSLWIGNDLSNVEKLCVQSFLDHEHEFHLYTYGPIGGVPQGAVIKDGNEILPASEIFKNDQGGVANFSDWFRYALLYERGNVWVDMDVVCIRPFFFDSDVVFGKNHDASGFGTAVIALPKGHILAESMQDAGRNHTKVFPWEDLSDKKKKLKKRWLRRGKEGMEFNNPLSPGGTTKAIKYFGLTPHAKPFMFFYPIYFGHWQDAFNDSYSGEITLYENTHAIHLWNEMSRRMPGFNKNARFDKESLFEQLKNRHDIQTAEHAPRISSAELHSITSLDRQNRKRKKRNTKIAVLLVLLAVFVVGWVVGRQ